MSYWASIVIGILLITAHRVLGWDVFELEVILGTYILFCIGTVQRTVDQNSRDILNAITHQRLQSEATFQSVERPVHITPQASQTEQDAKPPSVPKLGWKAVAMAALLVLGVLGLAMINNLRPHP